MVVRKINSIEPTDGVVVLPKDISMTGVNQPLKMWAGIATTDSNGEWSINFASAGFSQVRTIQVSIESGITNAAEKPLGTYVANKNNTSASGKCYSVSSAGLLAAMQQVAVGSGVSIHVLVIGI